MQAGKRYSFLQTASWTFKHILLFALWGAVPVVFYFFFGFEWLNIPWQPISLIGIAVAFYLGFKNNSSYDRLWEGRKIWGGIVNTSRSFTVMVRDFINNDEALESLSDDALQQLRKSVVHRHIAWLHALALQLRKVKKWEHNNKQEQKLRVQLGVDYKEENFEKMKAYLSQEEYDYVMSKGNHASHLLSSQSKDLMRLRQSGIIEHFRHLEIQGLITELYTLQGKAERIKNFPFPRQYATVNYFFVVIFILLLPFGMLDVFSELDGQYWIWLSIPFSVIGSWVFWMMEMIGEYSENPFEGLFNDVPISNIATGIEIDIRQMLDETDLPNPVQPVGDMELLM
jgi:putative membrane protein